MPKSARNSRRPWRKAIFPPLMLFCLLFWGACKPKIIHEPVLIGSVRVVAKVRAGAPAPGAGGDQRPPFAFVKWAVRILGSGNGKAAAAGTQTLSQGNIEQKVSMEQGEDNPGEVKAEILTRIFD